MDLGEDNLEKSLNDLTFLMEIDVIHTYSQESRCL